MLGKKNWENAPKDYLSMAVLKVDIREPYAVEGAPSTALGALSPNESEIMRRLESDQGLAPIVANLDLTKRWEMGTPDATLELNQSVDLDLDPETDELTVTVKRHDPKEAAEIASAVVNEIPNRIRVIDQLDREAAGKRLDDELQPFLDAETEARTALKSALAANGIPIDPKPGQDLGAYNLIDEVVAAKIDWDHAIDVLRGARNDQFKLASHWKKKLRPSFVVEKPLVPKSFVGPKVEPFQQEGALYGMTLGLVLGALASLLCWKLFS